MRTSDLSLLSTGSYKSYFFDHLSKRGEFLTNSLHGGENGVFTDTLSKAVTTHLVDPGQGNELLCIQTGQEVRAVLDSAVTSTGHGVLN